MSVYFNKAVVGQSLPEAYGIKKCFKIFRYAEIKNKEKEPEAWFIVQFQLKNMDVRRNRTFSLIPMFFLLHFKGFRSKYWLMDEATNTCMGVYRWQTLEDAQRYANSIAMKFMKKRSTPSSVKFCIGEGAQPRCAF